MQFTKKSLGCIVLWINSWARSFMDFFNAS